MVAGQSPRESDRETFTISTCGEDWNRHRPEAGNANFLIRAECDAIRLTLEILVKETARCPDSAGVEWLHLSADEIIQQFSANVSIKKSMFELVLEAPKTAITGCVAVLRMCFGVE
jgi:hypothetical protein